MAQPETLVASWTVTWLRTIAATFPPAVRAAVGTLRRAPLRSFILLQGVLWATVLGILPPAVIRGSREASISRARELGSDRILVYDGDRDSSGWRWDTAARIRSLAWREVRVVTGFARRTPFLETDAATAEDCGRRVVAGRWFSSDEIRAADPVCLVPEGAATGRLGKRQAVGEALEIGGRNLRIIGVFEALRDQGAKLDGFGYQKDHPLYHLLESTLPLVGFQPVDFGWIRDEPLIVVPRSLDSGAKLDVIEVRADPTELVRVTRALRRELIGTGLQPLLMSNLMVQIVFSGPMDAVDKLLRITFLVCLVPGTVIVTNLLILTVLQRRREIAVRRVEGATTLSIAVQFIIENGTLCFAGALAGIPVALGLAEVRTSLDPSGAVHWIFPVAETVKTIGVVTVFGLVGGLLPALKAARIQPAEVLAHE